MGLELLDVFVEGSGEWWGMVKVGLEVRLREICILVMAACENCKVCKGLFI